MATPTMNQLAELVQQNNAASAKLALAVGTLSENLARLTERQVRMETRLVKLASHLGLDANGDKKH